MSIRSLIILRRAALAHGKHDLAAMLEHRILFEMQDTMSPM